MRPRGDAADRERAVLVHASLRRAFHALLHRGRDDAHLRVVRRLGRCGENHLAGDRGARRHDHAQVGQIVTRNRDRLRAVLRRLRIVGAGKQRVAAWRHVADREGAVPVDARSVAHADLPARARRFRDQLHVAGADRRAIRVEDAAVDVRRAHEAQRKIDVEHFLAQADADWFRLIDRLHTGKIGRRIRDVLVFASEVAAAANAAAPAEAAPTAGSEAEVPCDAADVVVARHQAPHAELAFVVGLRSAGRYESPIALQILIAHHVYVCARHRLAVFVEQTARNDAAARQTKINALHLLTVVKLQRRARLKRSPLPIRERYEADFRRCHRIAARRQFGDLEDAAVVGEYAAAARKLGGRDEDARTFDRMSVIPRDDPAGDSAGRHRHFRPGRCISRRLLRRR